MTSSEKIFGQRLLNKLTGSSRWVLIRVCETSLKCASVQTMGSRISDCITFPWWSTASFRRSKEWDEVFFGATMQCKMDLMHGTNASLLHICVVIKNNHSECRRSLWDIRNCEVWLCTYCGYVKCIFWFPILKGQIPLNFSLYQYCVFIITRKQKRQR